jgi:hypothetical protein
MHLEGNSYLMLFRIKLGGSNPRRSGGRGMHLAENEKYVKNFSLNPEGKTILIDLDTDVSIILIWPFRN